MSLLPANYINVVNELKDKIPGARHRAILSVNKELNLVYWEIGNIINQLQKEQGWGTKVIERLSVDLKTEFPDFKGLSLRNLKYMSLLARRFPQFGQQPVAQLGVNKNQSVIVGQQFVAQLPWGHLQVHIQFMCGHICDDVISDIDRRVDYIQEDKKRNA